MTKLAQIGRSLGWSTISVFVIAGSQLGFMAVMGRLLSPSDFGLVAIAGLSLRFATYFAQLGVAPAVVQKANLSDDDIAAGFSVSLVLGAGFTAVTFFAAPLAESFFEMSGLAQVIRVLAASFFITSVGIVPNALLRRAMRFRSLALIEISAYLVGYGLVGLGCAWAGYGVWALVAATLTQALITAFGSFFLANFRRLKLKHTKNARSHFLAFGSKYSLIGFVEFLSFNVDSIIVGKLTGQSLVGQYNRAMLLANLPVQQPVSVLTRVLLPSLAQAQSEPEKFRTGVQVSIIAVAFYAFVVSAIISVSARDIVELLLGPQWGMAAEVLVVLAIGAAPYCISIVAGITMDAQAMLRPKLLLQSTMLVFLAGMMILLTPRYGVFGAACALVATEWLRMAIYLVMFAKKGLLNPRFIGIAIGFPVLILIIILAVLGQLASNWMRGPHVLNILVNGVLSILIMMIVIFGARPLLVGLPAMQAVIQRMPRLGRILMVSAR